MNLEDKREKLKDRISVLKLELDIVERQIELKNRRKAPPVFGYVAKPEEETL